MIRSAARSTSVTKSCRPFTVQSAGPAGRTAERMWAAAASAAVAGQIE